MKCLMSIVWLQLFVVVLVHTTWVNGSFIQFRCCLAMTICNEPDGNKLMKVKAPSENFLVCGFLFHSLYPGLIPCSVSHCALRVN